MWFCALVILWPFFSLLTILSSERIPFALRSKHVQKAVYVDLERFHSNISRVVYNLEIRNGHEYGISAQRLVAHNASALPGAEVTLQSSKQTFSYTRGPFQITIGSKVLQVRYYYMGVGFVLVDPDQLGSQLEFLRNDKPLVIGRTSPHGFQLPEDVGDLHVRITALGNMQFDVEDLGAAGGTRVLELSSSTMEIRPRDTPEEHVRIELGTGMEEEPKTKRERATRAQQESYLEAVSAAEAYLEQRGWTRGSDVGRKLVWKDRFLVANSLASPRGGWTDVTIHGNSRRFAFTDPTSGEIKSVSIMELSEWMRTEGYTGGPIRLLSCSSGRARWCGINVAQKLADEMRVPVVAPTYTTWGGLGLYLGKEIKRKKGDSSMGFSGIIKLKGEWKVFFRVRAELRHLPAYLNNPC